VRGAAGDPVHAARPAREDRCAQRHGSYFADRVLSGGPDDPDSTLGGPLAGRCVAAPAGARSTKRYNS